MRIRRSSVLAGAGAAALALTGLTAAGPALAAPHPASSYLGPFTHTKKISSTIPSNGDLNPYGVAVVDQSMGKLRRGSVLVSNFNNSDNQQGTGSTIVQISPGGVRTLFAQISSRGLPGICPGGIGLTTALVEIHDWVIVGSLPSANGQATTARAGCLLVLDSDGRVREVIAGRGINGPWDSTAFVTGWRAQLFVANVLNGTVPANGNVINRGTVMRYSFRFFPQPGPLPRLTGFAVVGSGFAQKTDPNAFVIGPTGLGIGFDGSLYVADTVNNRITRISNALTRPGSGGTGTVVTSGGLLNGPLGLTIAPNGNILTVNGGDGNIVETTPRGAQVAFRGLDSAGSPPGAGALFGLAIVPGGRGVYYVDDNQNSLRVLF
jgi:hypothetical protein